MARVKNKPEKRLSSRMLWLIFGLGLAGLSGWNISGWAQRNFETICHNYQYNDCMKFYWQTLPYFRDLMAAGLGTVVIVVITWLKDRTKVKA
ncbi:hypothetical protein M1116_04060 [Patescibacteria group bacterium]|nr:hypothetical protein [Patescibacteria group bacterium]